MNRAEKGMTVIERWFIDPETGEVDIIQVVGWAIRLSEEYSVGNIVLPVFVEDGEDSIIRIEESNFQPVCWVLDALKPHGDDLVDELDAIRTDMGRRGETQYDLAGLPKLKLIFLHR